MTRTGSCYRRSEVGGTVRVSRCRARLHLLLQLGLLAAGAVASRGQDQPGVPDAARGRELMAAGRYAEAVPVYRELVAQLPGNPGLLLNWAWRSSSRALRAKPSTRSPPRFGSCPIPSPRRCFWAPPAAARPRSGSRGPTAAGGTSPIRSPRGAFAAGRRARRARPARAGRASARRALAPRSRRPSGVVQPRPHLRGASGPRNGVAARARPESAFTLSLVARSGPRGSRRCRTRPLPPGRLACAPDARPTRGDRRPRAGRRSPGGSRCGGAKGARAAEAGLCGPGARVRLCARAIP